MEKNQNTPRYQEKSGNNKDPKHNEDYNRKETDPNNPTAKPNKQNGNKQNDGKGQPKKP